MSNVNILIIIEGSWVRFISLKSKSSIAEKLKKHTFYHEIPVFILVLVARRTIGHKIYVINLFS